jgi:hypothetical protein
MSTLGPLTPGQSGELSPLVKKEPASKSKVLSTVQNVISQPVQSKHVQSTAMLSSKRLSPDEPTIDYATFRYTSFELDALQPKVYGEIAKLLNEGSLDIENQCPIPSKPETGSLHPLESAVLSFYTAAGFKVMNGSFGHDTSIRAFMKGRKIPEDKFAEVKNAGRLLALIGTSALNKLPASQEITLYRGSALTTDGLAKMVPGTQLKMNRFSSTSVYPGMAWSFAQTNATQINGTEVLYIIENPTRAKNVDAFSTIKERERVYAPQQKFEVSRVEKNMEPVLNEIQDKEEIEEAKKDGAYKVIDVTKEKTISYVLMETPDGAFLEETSDKDAIEKARLDNTLVEITKEVTKTKHFRIAEYSERIRIYLKEVS